MPDVPDWVPYFRKSDWFTRGWTLQELIAPESTRLVFFNKAWHHLGTKRELAEDIKEITSIPTRLLRYDHHLTNYSIAARMSWAARRTTSVIEDMAYCLLGLFDVNMPLLYGEGGKAFMRLQEQILLRSHDESIFAWERTPILNPVGGGLSLNHQGLLAPEVSYFANSDGARVTTSMRPHYELTNKGLSIKARRYQLKPKGCVVVLNCCHSHPSGRNGQVLLLLMADGRGRYLCLGALDAAYAAFQLLRAKALPPYEKIYIKTLPGFWDWRITQDFEGDNSQVLDAHELFKVCGQAGINWAIRYTEYSSYSKIL